MDKENIFNNILSHENNVSSILVNLSSYDLFKKEFLAFLDFNLDSLDYKNMEIYTEINLEKDKENFGRIDIMLIDDKNNKYLIENKITNYRNLTDKQEEQYIQYIKKTDQAQKLIFLIPKNYEHLKTIQSMKNNNNEIIEIKYWQNFVKHFKQSGIYELNQFIQEFIDFLEKWFLPCQVKFSQDEIKIITNKKDVTMNNAKIATIMKKLIKIIEDVYIKKKPRSNATDYEGYGYAIDNNKYEINNDLFVWFGIDYDIWEKYGCPLIFWIETENDNLDKIEKILSDNKIQRYQIDSDEGLFFPFDNLEDKNIKEKIEGKIFKMIDKLKEID